MKNINRISAGFAAIAFLVVASAAYAQTVTTIGGAAGHSNHKAIERPIVGVVTLVNNGSISMTVQASSTAAITTYTVSTNGAKIIKSGATTTVSSIQINDKIAVIGTVSGTDIAAKTIIDGILPHTTGPPTGIKGGRFGSTTGRSFASSTQPFVRPAAFGTVSAINGSSSFSLAEKTKTGTTTLSIDTNQSTVFREGTTTASFSTIAVGNLVAVSGTTTSTNEILASKVTIMQKTTFGKGSNGHKKGLPKGFKGTASTTEQ